MPDPQPRSLRGLVVAVLLLLLALGLALAEIYLSWHHTLYNNGRWTATKTTLDSPVMGAFNYLFSTQPLVGGHLNLAAWHGYQEVVSAEAFDPVSIEVDVYLKPKAWLVVELNRAAGRYVGIRLSRNRQYRPAVVWASAAGRFVHRRPFPQLRRVKVNRWHTLRIDFADDAFAVSLDGQGLRRFETPIARPQKIGFRAGRRAAYIDDVRVTGRDGTVFRERFERPANAAWIRVAGAAGTLLAAAALFLLLRALLRVDAKLLLFHFLMFAGVLLVLAGLVWGLTRHRSGFYPDQSEKLQLQERYWIQATAETIFAEIDERYPREPAAGIHRLVVVGSSQTRGAGAARRDETFARQTERLLNERAGERRFEVINTGISGYKVADMARMLEERWLDFHPHTVIVNASNNDLGSRREPFERRLTEIVEACREAGARAVFVMEPNAVEHKFVGALRKRHAMMAAVAEAHGVPVIDMHAHLAERHDDGLLWWDWVHLTSYGQRLFAEHLVDELTRLELVDPGS